LLRVRSATFDNLFEAISVFASDGRLYLWNRRFCEVWGLDETWLGEHPRVDELVPAWRAGSSIQPPLHRSVKWSGRRPAAANRGRAGYR
jgi:PAS domain-containing protein